LIAWLIVSIVTLLFVAAFAVALARHGLALGRTAKRMADEVSPLTKEISQEAERASARAGGLQAPTLGRKETRR
jgi:hypothetical protein